MATVQPISETKVLAIASHVTYGYVGNKMATFVMQALGCDVSAIHSVLFSNHTAYKQWKGRKVPAEEMQEIYDGLKQSNLGPFDMMLSGYVGSKEAAELVGQIGRDLKFGTHTKPGSFFWVLDPVMGDEGKLYVAEDIVPVYKSLLSHADLILPNCFEAEVLSEMEISDIPSLVAAITKLHQKHRVPHIIVTSLRFAVKTKRRASFSESDTLAVVGSTCRSDFSPRIFSVTVPSLPIFFSGTGDLFAALLLVRLREASVAVEGLMAKQSWLPSDDMKATSLPLAKATEKVLASMHAILQKTAAARARELGEESAVEERFSANQGEEQRAEDEKMQHLKQTKASEIKVVRCVGDLVNPQLDGDGPRFAAEEVALQ